MNVPEVVDFLVAAFRQIDNISVFDGPTPSTPQRDAIAVGAGRDVAVAMARTPQGFARDYDEVIQVACMAWSASGSTEMKPRRDRCDELLAAVSNVITADHTLGGICGIADLGPQVEWVQQSGQAGAMCSVGFVVTARTLV